MDNNDFGKFMNLKLRLTYLILLILMVSCGKELFRAYKNSSNTTSTSLNNYSSSLCTNHTLIRPPVDLLFIWDNSTSTTFLNDGTKTALNKTTHLRNLMLNEKQSRIHGKVLVQCITKLKQ